MSPAFTGASAPVDRSAVVGETGTMTVPAVGATGEFEKPNVADRAVSKEVRAGSEARGEIPLLARLEQQREDRRAWAAAVQAAERAAAMAATLARNALADPAEKPAPFEIMQATDEQRQLDVALRIVRMPDTAGLRFELRL